MRNIKLSLQIINKIIFITLICSGLWVFDVKCSTIDTNLSGIIGSTEKEAKNEEQEKLAVEKNYLKTGQEMFYSGNLDEARKVFDNVLKLNSRNVQAQYFLGLIEYEEGNIEKAKIRFQIAHECLGFPPESKSLEVKQAQLQFPDDYQARIYYKDGWYIKPKNPSNASKNFLSLDAGSSYKIELISGPTKYWLSSSIIGSIVLLSFFLVR